MDMTRRRSIIYGAVALSFLSMLIAAFKRGEPEMLVWLTAGHIAATVLLWLALWRCPRCGRHLGRLDFAVSCRYCGADLYEKR